MSEPLIEIQNLSKMYRLFRHPRYRILNLLGFPVPQRTYNEFWALRDINLTINQGERLGIIGRNGAGKSTLLKIIAGLLQPTSGVVKVRGKVQALMELGTGFHHEFTGRENVFAALSYQGITGKEAQRRFEEIVEFSELEEFIDNPFKTYSAGMQARLTFSVATAVEPEILIIDEVLGAGDAYFAGKCIERMKSLTVDGGTTVLFVSHDLNAVQAMCNRAIWIKRGQIIQEGEPLNLSRAYYKEVQEEENLRLKARSQGLSKQKTITSDNSAKKSKLLFHFVTTNGQPPKGKHKIRHLKLCSNNTVLGEVYVGNAMDNNSDEATHVLSQVGYTDWSQPQRDYVGYYRLYTNCHSRYKHAPFQFDISLNLDESGTKKESLQLEILGDFDPVDQVCVELYESNGYRRLGLLEPGEKWQQFVFNLDDGFDKKAHVNSQNIDKLSNIYRFLFQPENSDFVDAIHISSIYLCDHNRENIIQLYAVDRQSDNKLTRFWKQEGWQEPTEIKGVLSQAVCNMNDGSPKGFETILPLTREQLFTDYRLVLHALPSKIHTCQVFIENNNDRIRVGEILPQPEPEWQNIIFNLDIATGLNGNFQTKPGERPRKSLVTWQVPDPCIEGVRFLNSSGVPTTGIEEGDDLIVEINYYSSRSIEKPVFAMTIYLLDGTNLCHANTVLANFEIEWIYGHGQVRFIFAPFYVGPGEYVVSASIFKYLIPNKMELYPFYDQHDRAYHFRVWKRLGNMLNVGLLRLPYTVEHFSGNNDNVE